MTSSSKTPHYLPIYILNLPRHDGELYAIHPKNAEETKQRLLERHIDPVSIHMLPDASYLERTLRLGQSINEKSVVVLGGGYTPLLAQELEHSYPLFQQSVNKGILNVWGQCAGGNVLCNRVQFPSDTLLQEVPTMRIFPVISDTLVYPIERKDPVWGDLINRKLISAISSSGHIEFMTYWYRGSHYTKDLQTALTPSIQVHPSAYYSNAIHPSPPVPLVAEIRGVTLRRAKIIASGIHPEIIDVEIPGQTAVIERLSADQNRKNHLDTIYRFLEILPEAKL